MALTHAHRGLLAGLLLAAGITAPLRVADAQGRPSTQSRQYSPEEIQRGRQKSLEALMTGDGAGARWTRVACADADMVASKVKSYAEGNVLMPEAVEECLTAMTRHARDGQILGLHYDIMRRLKDDPAGYEAMPQRIADAIQAGSTMLPVGQGVSLPITSGLALDTGFMSAWTSQGAGVPGTVSDPARIRAATETCLTQHGDNKTCFTVGYVQGAMAYQIMRRSAAR